MDTQLSTSNTNTGIYSKGLPVTNWHNSTSDWAYDDILSSPRVSLSTVYGLRLASDSLLSYSKVWPSTLISTVVKSACYTIHSLSCYTPAYHFRLSISTSNARFVWS